MLVGNIPIEATEEGLIGIMKIAGPVVSIRRMFDQDSGAFKGIAHCEYATVASAQLAERNLNGHILMARNLRVMALKDLHEQEHARAVFHAQVLALTHDQIKALPEPERLSVLELRDVLHCDLLKAKK